MIQFKHKWAMVLTSFLDPLRAVKGGKMKVEEKDPRVPFVVGPERAETIRRQADEVVCRMVSGSVFVERARDLRTEIVNRLAEIDKEIAEKIVKDDETKEAERLELLAGIRDYQESRRRTPDQLADEEREKLFKAASNILEGSHNKRMAGRFAHWQTTCRFDGCEKQPRTGKRTAGGHKAHRRTFVFCPGHSGVRNMISGADYRRLKANSCLRVMV